MKPIQGAATAGAAEDQRKKATFYRLAVAMRNRP
jgi:hypothetical protein